MAINYTQTRLTHLAFEDIGKSDLITTIRLPRLTDDQVAKGSPLFENGNIAYNTDTNKFIVYEDGNWNAGVGGAGTVTNSADLANDNVVVGSGTAEIKTVALLVEDVIKKGNGVSLTVGTIPKVSAVDALEDGIPLAQVAQFKNGDTSTRPVATESVGMFYFNSDAPNTLQFSTGTSWLKIALAEIE